MPDDQKRITVKIVGDSKEFELSLTKAQLKMVEARGKAAQLAESLKKQADSANNAAKATQKVGDAAHASVTGTQAAAGAIRVLEGNLGNNIRAAEKFITTIPGLSSALKAAFPVVGAIAITGVVTELVDHINKLKQALKDIEEAPGRITGAVDKLTSGTLKNIDELDVQNAKLQESIDKIQGKPHNGLALAIAESKKAANELTVSLVASVDQLDEILKKESFSHFSLSGFLGNAQTEGVSKQFSDFQKKVTADKAKYNLEQLDAENKGDTKGAQYAAELSKNVEVLNVKKQLALAQENLADFEKKQRVYLSQKAAQESGHAPDNYQQQVLTVKDHSANIALEQGVIAELSAKLLEVKKTEDNLSQSAKLHALELAKESSDAYKSVRQALTQLADKLKEVSEVTEASTPLEMAHAKAFGEAKAKIDSLNESLHEHGLSVAKSDAARITSLEVSIAEAELAKKTNDEFKRTVEGIKEKIDSYKRLTAAINQSYEAQRSQYVQDELSKVSKDKNFNPAQVGALRAGLGYQFDQESNSKVATSLSKTADHTAILNAEANAALKGSAAVREQALAEKIANETHGKSAEQIAAITRALTDEANAQERLKTDQMIERLQQETAAQERLNEARLRGADAVREAQLQNRIADIKATTQAGPDQDKLIADTVSQSQVAEQTRILDLATQIDFAEKKKLEDLDKQLAKMKEIGASAYAIKEVEKERQDILDKVALQSGSLSDVMRATADRMGASAQNVRQQISDAMIALQDGINDNITKLALGEKTDWGKMFKDQGGSILKSGLKDVEGQVLGKFGLSAGKRDGSSASSALYVQIAGQGGSGLGGLLKGGGGSEGGGLFGGGSQGGGIFSMIGDGLKSGLSSVGNLFAGGFAEGGDIPGSSYAMVGEAGPELIKTGAAGAHVIPNHALGGTNVTHIDARGTDPVLVEARIKASSKQAYSAAKATSQKQLTDMSNRRSR